MITVTTLWFYQIDYFLVVHIKRPNHFTLIV